MPFEQKYSDETREQALARVLDRRAAEPGNRAIIRETAEQFDVGEQSLRGWIRAYEKANAPTVTTQAAPPAASASSDTDETEAETPSPAPARRGRPAGSGSAASADRVAELEAEVSRLRRDKEALKSALAVLLAD
ncbi:transposase [Frigoribacterium sp. 2-23]|uniref:transposase n=1 Tax=Frigoribacterium sp. 2-23 TaxID=3415006 RepID=UPI003C6F872F